MHTHNIGQEEGSFALTLLSLAECITYIVASFLGDWFKGKLVYVNVIAASCLAVICLFWPVLDVSFGVICLISMSKSYFMSVIKGSNLQ